MANWRKVFLSTLFLAGILVAVLVTLQLASSAIASSPQRAFICIPSTMSQTSRNCQAIFNQNPPKCPSGLLPVVGSCQVPSQRKACVSPGNQVGFLCYCDYNCVE